MIGHPHPHTYPPLLSPAPPSRRRLVVAVEGCDGSGKTTLCQSLTATLTSLSPPIPVLPLKRPAPGSLAQHLLASDRRRPTSPTCQPSPQTTTRPSPSAIAAALNEDARLCVARANSIPPGSVALLDRHWLSFVVEQATHKGPAITEQRALHSEPDLWVICTADWRTIAERLALRGDHDARMGVGEIGARLALYECAADHLQSPVVWLYPDHIKLTGCPPIPINTLADASHYVAAEIRYMLGVA